MPKNQVLDPKEIRKSGFVKFKDIPVNQYSKTIAEEKTNFSDDDLVRIYRDMAIIREFETMLYEIKTTNAYNGVEYNNPGPAHLSWDRRLRRWGRLICSTNTITSSVRTAVTEKSWQKDFPAFTR